MPCETPTNSRSKTGSVSEAGPNPGAVSIANPLAGIVEVLVRAKIAYRHLQRHQNRVRMTEQSHRLQTTIDLIWARLKFSEKTSGFSKPHHY